MIDALTEMRGWLLDCGADPDWVDDLSDAAVERVVRRNFDGGLAGFYLAIA